MTTAADLGELLEEGQLVGIIIEVNLGIGALVGLVFSRFYEVRPYLL